MPTRRTALLGFGAATVGLLASRTSPLLAQGSAATPPAAASSKPGIKIPPPISQAERMQRIEKVQGLLRAAGLNALLVEAGSSLIYFTGVQWWRSERLTAALIPAEGSPLIVTPEFEEPSVRETLGIQADVRVWNEHQSPT